METLVLLAVAVGAVLLWRSVRRPARMRKRLAKLPGFTPSVLEVVGPRKQVLAIDTQSNKFAIMNKGRVADVFGFSDITAVEISKNGETVTQTNRGSQAVGAAVGAVLLGPLGLLLGGVTGSKRSSEKIKKMSLKVFTNDLAEPVREIVFHDGPALKAEEIAQSAGGRQMEQWYGRLRTIVSRAEVDAA